MADNRLWVLGAADPEMAAIERLLRDAGEKVAYAVDPDGQRVHPGNAYQSAGVRGGELPTTSTTLVLVECDGPGIRGHVTAAGVIVIDHHRPGDPGYGMPPERFLEASSIGQVAGILGLRSGLANGVRSWGCVEGSPMDLTGIDWDAPPDRITSIIMVAAADHCLEAAYRGQCPGVDPDELMRFRAAARAVFRGVPVEQVMAEIEAARQRLRLNVGSWVEHDVSGHEIRCQCDYADFRGTAPIPELPEAACREGIPFIADQTDRDGRRKIVLMAVPQGSDLVQRFMRGEIVPGLCDYYGDSARGFAGGYLEPR